MRKILEHIFYSLITISIPFIRLIIVAVTLFSLRDYSTMIINWIIFIAGIIWAFSFYYDEYRFNKLERECKK